MFLGVDHGTTAIRFASEKGSIYELSRSSAADLSYEQILSRIEESLGPERVDLVALSYSMGDGLTRIVRLEDALNRGLISQDGAGLHQGGGTRVFEAIRASGWPAILLPGIHRASNVDPRMKVFSHGMSPEKVGLAYGVFRQGSSSFIVCDASSNTVSFAVLRGEIVAAIDAPIFAPGLLQGPLDVQAIRDVDSGKLTANQAFNWGGILSKMKRMGLINAPRRSAIWPWRPSPSSLPWRWLPFWSSAATGVLSVPSSSWPEARQGRSSPGYPPIWIEGSSLWRDRRLLRAAPG